ncbi:MAG: carboxypeptidase-like regulatory domain-containing protein [Planctomycetaceae bacterium]|jgi:hypothetical protein|nr:carboxypeptidase-like regulatory domain-containing protein [Planctomycetaceae bacterium]
MKYSRIIVSVFLLIFLVSGCGQKKRPDGMPPLVTCSVLVQQENTPLANANVSLIPEDGSKWNAAGTTDVSGVAKLYTLSQYEGVPEGKYNVVVSKTETIPGIAVPSGSSAKGTPDQHFKLVEPQFSNPTTTPLTLNIIKGTSGYEINAGKAVRIQEKQR